MQVLGRDGSAELEAGDLGKRVDACIRAAGALRERRLAGDAAERRLQFALDGREAGLNLPALKIGAVVSEGELPGLEVRGGLVAIGQGSRWIR